MLLDDEYEWAPHRWLALRDRRPIGVSVRGKLSSRLLAQELVCEPWQVLVACVLSNRTVREVSHPALWRVLWRYRTPHQLALANDWDLKPLIERCSLATKRADTLKRMCADFVAGVRSPFGVGGYTWQSYLIFVHGESNVAAEDLELYNFLNEMRSKPRDLMTLVKKRSVGLYTTHVQIEHPIGGTRRR